jgi:hypothetical protein
VGLVESGKLPKSLTWLLNYSRKYSLRMFQWGLAVLRDRDGCRDGEPPLRHHAPGGDPLPGRPAPVRPHGGVGSAVVRVVSSPVKIERVADGTVTQHTVIRDGDGRIVHECA